MILTWSDADWDVKKVTNALPDVLEKLGDLLLESKLCLEEIVVQVEVSGRHLIYLYEELDLSGAESFIRKLKVTSYFHVDLYILRVKRTLRKKYQLGLEDLLLPDTLREIEAVKPSEQARYISERESDFKN